MDELSRKIAELKRWTHCIGKMDSASTYPGEYWLTGTSKTNVLPAWTTDIAAAWGLVEEMQQAGLRIDIEIWLNGYVIGVWRPGEQLLFKQRYDTAPEAISRAYLAYQEAVQQEAK